MQKEFRSVLKTKSKHSHSGSTVRDPSRPKSGATSAGQKAELEAVKKQNEELLKKVSALQNLNKSQQAAQVAASAGGMGDNDMNGSYDD